MPPDTMPPEVLVQNVRKTGYVGHAKRGLNVDDKIASDVTIYTIAHPARSFLSGTVAPPQHGK
jgi:hypothetical protein